MANTFDYTPKPEGSFWSLAELNLLFTTLRELIEGKLDRRGGVLKSNLRFVAGGGIINLPDPGTSPGEVIPQGAENV